jgi:hypothetical protein
MAARTLRTAVIVHGTKLVSSIVLPSDNGDAYLAAYDGTILVPDTADEYGEDFVTLTGCVAVEVTGMDPMPGVGSGWTFVDGQFVAPPVEELPEPS